MKLENLEEMDKFLDTCVLPKLNQEDINNLNNPVIDKQWDWGSHNIPPTKKSPGLDGFTAEFHQTFEEMTLMLLKLFREGMVLNLFYETSITLIHWVRYNNKKRKL
jgi:hypothetical protein